MKRRLMYGMMALSLLGALPAITVGPAAGASAAAPCTDGDPASNDQRTYAERRQFVEAQGWWKKNPGAPAATLDSGHIHVGACIPERETVTGRWDLYVRVQLHDHAGAFSRLAVVAKGNGYENKVVDLTAGDGFLDAGLTQRSGSTWSGASSQNSRWFKVPFDTAADFRNDEKGAVSGRQEVRIRVFTSIPDATPANQWGSTLIFQVNVKPTADTTPTDYGRQPYTRGHGFYKDGKGDLNTAYCDASIKGDTTSAPVVPDAPVPASWSPQVVMADHRTAQADRPVSAHHVVFDPRMHDDPAFMGVPVKTGTGDFPALNPAFADDEPTFARVSLGAAAAGLVPGSTHRMQLRSECDFERASTLFTSTQFPALSIRDVKPHLQATLTGALVVPFTLQSS